MMEFDFEVYDANKRAITVSTASMESPWLPRWMTMVRNAASRRGGCLDAAGKLYNWVMDIPAFKDVVYTKIWMPSSPWLLGNNPETIRLNNLAILITEDIKEFLKAGRTLLLGSGLSEELVHDLEQNCLWEIETARTPYHILLQQVYATRR